MKEGHFTPSVNGGPEGKHSCLVRSWQVTFKSNQLQHCPDVQAARLTLPYGRYHLCEIWRIVFIYSFSWYAPLLTMGNMPVRGQTATHIYTYQIFVGVAALQKCISFIRCIKLSIYCYLYFQLHCCMVLQKSLQKAIVMQWPTCIYHRTGPFGKNKKNNKKTPIALNACMPVMLII